MVIPIFAVDDLERSLSFYTQTLEFVEQFRLPGPNGPMFAMIALGNVSIGLSQCTDPIAPKGNGCVLMAYVPEDCDIDAYCERVKGRGVALEQELRDEYWGDRCFALRDPDGFYLQMSKTIKNVTAEEAMAHLEGERVNG